MRPSKEPLLKETEIRQRVAELAEYISRDYVGRELLLVPVLKGGAVFAADLMRQLTVPVTVEFIRARSYVGTRSKGTIEFEFLPEQPVTGKHVLVVEDILDTGRTTAAIFDRLEVDKPASMALCVLVEKPTHREVPATPNYLGFTIESQFVVGYGLDYNEHYRELPGIHTLDE